MNGRKIEESRDGVEEGSEYESRLVTGDSGMRMEVRTGGHRRNRNEIDDSQSHAQSQVRCGWNRRY